MKRVSLFGASIGVMIAGAMPVDPSSAAGQEGGEPISMQSPGPGRVEAPIVLTADQVDQTIASGSEVQVIRVAGAMLLIGSGSDVSTAIASPGQIAVSGFCNGRTFAYTTSALPVMPAIPTDTLGPPDPTVTPGLPR